MFHGDIEKTQAPPTDEDIRDMLKREQYQNQCGASIGREMTPAEKLAELFKYHSPYPDTIPKYAAINQAAKNFAEVILQNCPASADRSDAIRKIREARMTANASIALNGLNL